MLLNKERLLSKQQKLVSDHFLLGMQPFSYVHKSLLFVYKPCRFVPPAPAPDTCVHRLQVSQQLQDLMHIFIKVWSQSYLFRAFKKAWCTYDFQFHIMQMPPIKAVVGQNQQLTQILAWVAFVSPALESDKHSRCLHFSQRLCALHNFPSKSGVHPLCLSSFNTNDTRTICTYI